MNPASKDICTILQNGISGLTMGTNLFAGKIPAKPDNCVAVFDIPGNTPILYLDGSGYDLSPSVQVRARDVNYLNGWTMIYKVLLLLHGTNNKVVNEMRYKLIKALINPSLLEVDENNRNIFIADFNIYRQEETWL